MIALGLCALLSSCLELEQKVTLRADGSGVQTLRLGMSEASLSAARAQASVEESFSDPEKIFDERAVRRELAEAGLTCNKVRTFRERRRRFIEVEAEFDSLDQLGASPLAGGGAEWVVEPGPRPGSRRLLFYPRGRAAWVEARKRARELAAADDQRAAQFFARAKREVRGLELKWVIELPGDVVSASPPMEVTAKRRVEVTITDRDIETPEELLTLLAPRFEVTYRGRRAAPARTERRRRP